MLAVISPNFLEYTPYIYPMQITASSVTVEVIPDTDVVVVYSVTGVEVTSTEWVPSSVA